MTTQHCTVGLVLGFWNSITLYVVCNDRFQIQHLLELSVGSVIHVCKESFRFQQLLELNVGSVMCSESFLFQHLLELNVDS